MQNLSSNLSPERVKYFRKDNGWSQELLAKASGLSLRTIQRAEKDGNSSVETQLALSAAFDISPKELSHISPSIDVHWKRKNFMQSLLALCIVLAAVFMLLVISGDVTVFIDPYSILYLVLFMYSSTVIAFGSRGLIKSFTGLRYLFANDISQTPASNFLSEILKKQIYFVYGGAIIGFLIGSVAIHSHMGIEDPISQAIHPAYAVNLLVLLYSALIAEGILRPLATKLESR